MNVPAMTLALVVALAAAVFSLAATRRAIEIGAVLACAIELAASVVLAVEVTGRGTVLELGGALAADAFSATIALVTTAVSLAAAVYSITYVRDDLRGRDTDRGAGLRDLRRYYALFHLFVFTMLLVPLAHSLGVVWIAIEGTTLASLFLVSYYRTREALEAAWKYVIVGSVGIALALFGTILAYYAAVPVLGISYDLTWSGLAAVAPRLDPELMRLAFLFVIVGYGTKAGLAPMHTWLPDAHSEAPSPISALLSGVLLNGALYAVLRFYSLAAPSVGRAELDALLLGFGLLSIVVAALFMLRQLDYKRLLAYSSIEHMGIVAVAVAFGTPLALYGALLQLISHALAKSLMFFASGNVLLRFETKQIAQVTGVGVALPVTAPFLIVGGLALAGAPPFGVFTSELTILAGAFAAGYGPVAVAVLALVGVIFVAFFAHLNGMVFGRSPVDVVVGERWRIGTVALLANAVALVVLGVLIPAPLATLLGAAVAAIRGGAT